MSPTNEVNPQGVGASYNKESFKNAQQMGWQILEKLNTLIRTGQTEEDARSLYKDVMAEFGVEKNWHPPKIRFGPNTIKSFRELSNESYRLSAGDIYFLDLGPIIDGYEVDVGRSFVMPTNDPSDSLRLEQRRKAILDGKEIFDLVKDYFHQNKCRGPELYMHAESLASQRGWVLIDEGANGHRIGDFPHHGFYRGSLRAFDAQEIVPDLWILEIQITDLSKTFGSFTEDCLG